MFALGCGGGGTPVATRSAVDVVTEPDPVDALSWERVSLPGLGVSLEVPSDWELTTLGGVVVVAPRGADRDVAAVVALRNANASDPAALFAELLGTRALRPSAAPASWTSAAGDAGRRLTYQAASESDDAGATRAELYSLESAAEVWVALIDEGSQADVTRRVLARIIESLARESDAQDGGRP